MTTSTSSPTRIGFIGLSKNSWADRSHAPYLLTTDKFKIVALSNSSAQSAAKAVTDFGLPSSTKAYGNPQELANDPDVDLVVDSVRVDQHFPTIRPSLLAGKNVAVEWPLGKNLAEAEELLRLSKEHNVKQALVVAQDIASPIVQKLRVLLAEGRIGKVLSSSFTGQGAPLEVRALPEKYAYLYDPEVGGNIVTVFVGHALSQIQSAFGETLEISSSLLTNQIPDVSIIKDDGTFSPAKKHTHDHIMFLAKTSKTQFPFVFSLRQGAAFKGTPSLDWRIYGEKGEIKITAQRAVLADGLFGDETFAIHDFADGRDEVVDVKLQDEYAHLPEVGARNIARMYEAIRAGDSTNFLTFEQAVQIHRLLDQLLVANPI